MTGIVTNRKRAVGMKLTVLARQMRQRFDERVEQMGLTRTKWVLIATVSAHPGATQREIAEKLQVTDVTAGRLIDQMCADGLLQRRDSPHDRRAYSVVLTPAAQPVVEKLSKAADLYEAETFANFDDEDLDLLDRLLSKLSQNLCTTRRDTKAEIADMPVITPEVVDAA
jgi:MarR family transcriptional regulator for hemolysin